MILIFGGTTEGRIAVRTLDEAGNLYYYSTRSDTQLLECKHGIRISGEMDCSTIQNFCMGHQIRIIVDAAHPFAVHLHTNIATVAETLQIPVIRFERRYPERDDSLIWCDSFTEAIQYLEEHAIQNLLALTGVQTINKLRSYWSKHPCWFRVLDRADSLQSALQQGFPRERLLFWHEEEDESAILEKIRPEAILTKESGESGFFREKVNAAKTLHIPILVIKRPPLPSSFYSVNGEHGLRYRIERLLPDFYPLRSGFTTGTCATAATKAALQGLITGFPPTDVTITLPNGEEVNLPVSKFILEKEFCKCYVIKDAGDDPDVTDGHAICSEVRYNTSSEIRFLPGEGVGIVTLPGLGIPVGEPAINPTPKAMITGEVERTIHNHGVSRGIDICISVPDGMELARKTFNPKLGIRGGISIVGTSGVVRPFSTEAFIDSIRKEIQVAKALGCKHIVINSGAKSENALRERFPDLLPQAFIHYGNFIGETLKIAVEEGIQKITLGVMIGKAVKLAEGNLDTHSKKVIMNKTFIRQLAQESNCPGSLIDQIGGITLARELWTLFAEFPIFFEKLTDYCYKHCYPLIASSSLEIILVNDN